MSEFDEYLDHKEAFLDQFIDTGDEHTLFVSSYIHGHFSVQAAKVLNNSSNHSSREELVSQFETQLQQAVNEAIQQKELNHADAADVLQMLNDLYKV